MEVAAAEVEAALARLPDPSALRPEARERFVRKRQEIHRRYRAWRLSMPSLDTLFDDDRHRAKALAGNLATELEAALMAWVRALQEDEADLPGSQRRLAKQVAAWRSVARPVGRGPGWDAEAVGVFDSFLDELSARAQRRAQTALASPPTAPSSRVGGVLGVLGAGVVTVLRRVFRPDREPL